MNMVNKFLGCAVFLFLSTASPIFNIAAAAEAQPQHGGGIDLRGGDLLHVDVGFSMPLYRADDAGIYKVGSGVAAVGISYSVLTSEQFSLELGGAAGACVTLDGAAEVSDPVAGPTIGVGYSGVAAVNAWGVLFTEQSIRDRNSFAIGILFDIRL